MRKASVAATLALTAAAASPKTSTVGLPVLSVEVVQGHPSTILPPLAPVPASKLRFSPSLKYQLCSSSCRARACSSVLTENWLAASSIRLMGLSMKDVRSRAVSLQLRRPPIRVKGSAALPGELSGELACPPLGMRDLNDPNSSRSLWPDSCPGPRPEVGLEDPPAEDGRCCVRPPPVPLELEELGLTLFASERRRRRLRSWASTSRLAMTLFGCVPPAKLGFKLIPFMTTLCAESEAKKLGARTSKPS